MALDLNPPPPIDSSDVVLPPVIPLHPWRRFFARRLDHAVVAAAVLIAWNDKDMGSGVRALASVMGSLIWIPFEAVFLSSLGWTLGKWLFGVKVRTPSGDLLPWAASIRRAFWAATAGTALGLGIVELICMYQGLDNLREAGRTSWDEPEASVVLHAGIRWLPLVGLVTGVALLALVGLIAAGAGELDQPR